MADLQDQDRPAGSKGADARELQARLCREMGLLAVAAALDVRPEVAFEAPATESRAVPTPEKRAA
jgi:hypothetical protein